MAGLLRRRVALDEPVDLFDRMERMLEDWPMMRPLLRQWDAEGPSLIRVDELRENGALVIRAELPGVDPEKDVEVTVEDGMLRIAAERREEEETEEKGYLRREIRTGSFTRTLRLPEGVTEGDVTAAYDNGILEIRVPAPVTSEPKKIDIAKKS